MIVRFREDDRNDRHTRVSVFSSATASSEGTLGKSGDLVLDTPLWDALVASLPFTTGGVTFYPPLGWTFDDERVGS